MNGKASEIPKGLPRELALKIGRSRRRVRWIFAARGLCATAAAAVAVLMAAMAVDAMVLIVSPWARWALWGCEVAVVAAVAVLTLVVPLAAKLPPERLAALIERRHPELEERLSSVIGLRGDASVSPEMMMALEKEAALDAGALAPEREFSARTVRSRARLALALAGVVALAALCFPRAVARLAIRAILPGAEVDNLYASALEIEPGDITILAGTPVNFRLKTGPGFPDCAYIRTRPAKGGRETAERMTPTGDGEFAFFLPGPEESLRYRFTCASAISRSCLIRVAPVPAYSNIAVTLEFPAYTGIGIKSITNALPFDISAPPGTKAAVSALGAARDLSAVMELRPGGDAPMKNLGGEFRFEFEFGERTDARWCVRMCDVHGFTNETASAALRSIPDMAPKLRLVAPRRPELELPPGAKVAVECLVEEDFALSETAIEAKTDGGGWKRIAAPAPAAEAPGVWAFAAEVDLEELAGGSGGEVRLRAMAADNLPAALGGPHRSYSREVTVRIHRGAPTAVRRDLKELHERSRRSFEEANHLIDRARNAANHAKDSYREAPRNRWHAENAPKKLEESRQALEEARIKLAETAARLEESAMRAAAEPLRRLLEAELAPAAAAAAQIPGLKEEERSAAAEKFSEKLAAAQRTLRELSRPLERVSREAQALQRLEELADREEALADEAPDDTGELPAKEAAEEWAKKQDRLSWDLAGAFHDKASDPFGGERRDAEKLLAEADRLKERQNAIKEKILRDETDDRGGRLAAEEDDMVQRLQQFADRAKQLSDRFGEARRRAEERAAEHNRRADEGKSEEPHRRVEGENPAHPADEAAVRIRDASESAKGVAEAVRQRDRGRAEAKAAEVNERLERAKDELRLAMERAAEQSRASRGEGAQAFDQALGQMREASRLARKEGRGEAAARAREAARSLRSMASEKARALGAPEGMSGMQTPGMESPSGAPGEKPSASPGPGMRGAGRGTIPALGDALWFRIKNGPGAGGMGGGDGGVPREYQMLVKEYFEELSKEGAR